MSEATLNLKNSSFGTIQTDDYSFLLNVHEAFSYYAQGYRFAPKFKAKVWDGKIYLVKLTDASFPLGLAPKIANIFQDDKIKLSKEVADAFYSNIEDDAIEDFFADFKFYSKGCEIFPRADQMEAVKRSLKLKRCVNVCPTSFGKSLAIFMECLYHIKMWNHKIVLIVPTVDLVDQFYNDIQDYCTTDTGKRVPWTPVVHKISGKYNGSKYLPKYYDIVITTWQSVHSVMKQEPDWMNLFDCYILDETHKAKATVLQGISNSATNIEWRTGWTGSLKSNTVDSLLVEGCFGPMKEITNLNALMDDGVVARLKIALTFFDYPQELREKVHGLDYNNEIKFIESYKPRNERLFDIIQHLPTNGVMLFKHIAHGKKLRDIARGRFPNRNIYLIHGNHYERNGEMFSGIEVLKPMIEQERGSIIIANYPVFSTGLSLKSLAYVMFACPTKAYITVLQSIGRSLRVRHGKTSALLIDVIDDFSIPNRKGNMKRTYAYKHFIERFSIYTWAKLDYTQTKTKCGYGRTYD